MVIAITQSAKAEQVLRAILDGRSVAVSDITEALASLEVIGAEEPTKATVNPLQGYALNLEVVAAAAASVVESLDKYNHAWDTDTAEGDEFQWIIDAVEALRPFLATLGEKRPT